MHVQLGILPLGDVEAWSVSKRMRATWLPAGRSGGEEAVHAFLIVDEAPRLGDEAIGQAEEVAASRGDLLAAAAPRTRAVAMTSSPLAITVSGSMIHSSSGAMRSLMTRKTASLPWYSPDTGLAPGTCQTMSSAARAWTPCSFVTGSIP